MSSTGAIIHGLGTGNAPELPNSMFVVLGGMGGCKLVVDYYKRTKKQGCSSKTQ